MRATKQIKKVMIDKGITTKGLAELAGKNVGTLYQTFYNDKNSKGSGMSFETVCELADALGCDVILKDRETGEEY